MESNKLIKEAALAVGFDACGVAKAEALTEDAAFMTSWLAAGKHGEMGYLERNFEKRTDPRILVPGCKSVVVVLLNYYPERKQPVSLPQISKYAYSAIDYHTVIKTKLLALEEQITIAYGEDAVSKDHQHSFCDSAPVLEKRWAQKAGLGWIGKHTQLIHPRAGSYYFIGILMLNIEIAPATTLARFSCGTCTKCIDACPTSALSSEGLDAQKCISYLTLESKSDVPSELHDQLSGYIVGCDICNDVCPWNKKFAIPNLHQELAPLEDVFRLTHEDWSKMEQEQFNRLFKRSAVKRAKLDRIKKNLH